MDFCSHFLFNPQVGSNHPILKTAKNLLYNDKNNTQAWGLLILLVSKAAGYPSAATQLDQLTDGGVLQGQRMMAEIIEMIRTGHLVHKGLINFSAKEYSENTANLNFGNKIALLTGDYLLVTANGMLSKLRNQHLSEIVSSALRDLSDGEFVGDRDPQNMPIPSKPVGQTDVITEIKNDLKTREIIGYGRKFEALDVADCVGNPVREWTLRNTLDGGSLLGVGCQGVLHLAGHGQKFQDNGYLFGCHAVLAWQASYDYNLFASPTSDSFSLVSAPVLFALNEDKSLFEQVSCSVGGVGNVDYEKLSSAVLKSSALENTVKLFHEHCDAANRILDNFPDSRATEALRNIILALSVH